ncbi:hydroxyproline-rich glycoprotein DZ-HRGP [Colletotrichum tofieldiae]|nr:hydroxyproline-rich glycoprotein DZ-HRGP [Colletotrichum tofieldiae]GKT78836.1 hydroxyproline-rich glycoprotein DZ-HRGP [Colletotrichum tofieldiae]
MLTLYTKYKVEPERFQYEDIFRSRSEDALERIEFLYQDLECQYHLVQAAPRSHPNVPGLTPVGFAKWIISNILAYPDPEARRLHAIMSALPINADGPLLDGKPERLPRQLSRHLFPASHDKKVRKILDEAVWDCLEDVAPPLPSIPRARPGPSQDLARVPEANTHARRPGGGPRRPAPVPHRRTYDRGSHRVEPHPARLPRANSDAGASLPRHRDLPPPPMGRHSVPRRQRSPAPTNRYSASLPAISQHHVASPSPLSQPTSAYDIRGSDANYGVCSGRGSDSRDGSPRSPGLSRRGGAGAGADRGPTWEEVYSRRGSSGGRVSSVDAEPHRSSR